MTKGAKNPTIIDYIAVVVKWRKMIIVNFFVVTLLTAAYSLVMPKTFTAITTILPPSEESNGLGVASLVGSLPFGSLGLGNVTAETNIFIAILNSRTVMETIAKEFDLMQLYNTENMEETVKSLRENVSVVVNDDGTISVSASAQTGFLAFNEDEKNKVRNLAKDISNAFVHELDQVNSRLKSERAKNNRIFIEKRYLKNLSDLHRAEDSLKNFQEIYGVIALPEQTDASIQAAAELNAKITTKEIEVAVLSKYMSGSHMKLNRAKSELRELKRKLKEMKEGINYDLTSPQDGHNNTDLFIPLNEAPDIGLKYIRLYREVTLQEKLLEFLLPQYEQAKIQEAKDTPTVQVLDEAITPIKRTSPKRTIIVLLSGFLSLILSVCLILMFEYWQRVKREGGDDFEKLSTALFQLRRDFHLIRRKN
ncbi:MAG: GumC family protein [bacterium]